MYDGTAAAGWAGRGPSAPQIFSTGGLAAGRGVSMGLVTPGCLWGEAEGLERESRLVPEGAGSSRICCEARMGVGAGAAGGPEEDEAEAARGPEEDEAEAACGLEEVESESFDLLDDR